MMMMMMMMMILRLSRRKTTLRTTTKGEEGRSLSSSSSSPSRGVVDVRCSSRETRARGGVKRERVYASAKRGPLFFFFFLKAHFFICGFKYIYFFFVSYLRPFSPFFFDPTFFWTKTRT